MDDRPASEESPGAEGARLRRLRPRLPHEWPWARWSGRVAGAVVPVPRDAWRELGEALRTPPGAGRALLADAPTWWQRALPYLVACAFIAPLMPASIVHFSNEYHAGGGWGGALGVAQTMPLLLAVTRPVQAWLIMLVADVVGALVLLNAGQVFAHPWPWPAPTIIGYLALLVYLGLRAAPRILVTVWVITALVGVPLGFLTPAAGTNTHALLTVLAGVVLALTGTLRGLGNARWKVAEQERISEAERARRTLLEERTRIARELHDVVAHHMSVITVQADSAPYRVAGMPPEVREEFATIAASARESLTEMRRLLAVLRGADGSGGELAPQPGVGQVRRLVEATVRSGLPVDLSLGATVTDPPAGAAPVPSAVDLSAYRIVQEALANVVRHAPGAHTRVSVSREAASGLSGEALLVLVVNEAPEEGPGRPVEAASGTGHGLVGMRERVRLTGGTLDTGPLPDGGFRVAARLPLTGGTGG
ncbi:sensor histidine kinase [Streptomyces sp. BI20]|uniref:sensor histidine kinase n=1 Tax=Streptomyces sp. BI20 TaxID=3403460 RepID=UPI003C75DB67